MVPHAGGDDGATRARSFLSSLNRRGLVANAVGASVAYVYLVVVAPPQPPASGSELPLLLGIAPVYFMASVAISSRLGRRSFRPVVRWMAADRPPTPEERAMVLGLPWRAAGAAAIGWLVACLIFGLQTATHHPPAFVAGVVLGIFLAGLTTTGVTFLLAEQALRPLFAEVLAGEPPTPDGTSVRALRARSRLLISWALGSGVVLIAIAMVFLGRWDARAQEVFWPILFLVIAGLFAGATLIAAAARSIAQPVDRVRAAVARVGEGHLDEEVVVDDGGEIGFLQAGFNRMVAGLRERDRIRAVFGTYVDREVAEHILREGTTLEGEEVEVTILFVDIRNFTGMAERVDAREVVSTINRLFERIVPIIHAHEGHVDKFVGDGLMAVFGAPRRSDQHADQALRATLEIADAVDEEFRGDLQIGAGLNSGLVVAGNVGGGGRFEFSVIGDTVNVAARVEAATRTTGDTLLLSDNTKSLLSPTLASRLDPRPSVPLKGKTMPIQLFSIAATPSSMPGTPES